MPWSCCSSCDSLILWSKQRSTSFQGPCCWTWEMTRDLQYNSRTPASFLASFPSLVLYLEIEQLSALTSCNRTSVALSWYPFWVYWNVFSAAWWHHNNWVQHISSLFCAVAEAAQRFSAKYETGRGRKPSVQPESAARCSIFRLPTCWQAAKAPLVIFSTTGRWQIHSHSETKGFRVGFKCKKPFTFNLRLLVTYRMIK